MKLAPQLHSGSNFGASRARLWITVGIAVAGVLILAGTNHRRRRRRVDRLLRTIPEDFNAFVERFEILPPPQPPPPSAKLQLAGLTFAVSDNFDVKGHVSGFGNPDWKLTHEEANRSAVVVALVLKNGAKCIGRTIMDELAFGTTGENLHYGTPINPELPSQIPGGSSSGSAVAVAAELVDFAFGTDTRGCVRVPASYCGIFGFRPSHGAVSSIGILTNSQSLDTVGWFARNPAILHHVGNILLQASPTVLRRARRFVFADDCFQFLRVPKQKTMHVISKAIKTLSGYLLPRNMNLSQFIASNVPSLKDFSEPHMKMQQGASTFKALSTVMILLQRYEFKTNHEEWIHRTKPAIGLNISGRVLEAINSINENLKSLYRVRTEMRAALNSLLKDDGILVIPTTSDYPLKCSSKRKSSPELEDRLFTLMSIAGLSGCCQVTIPLGKHDSCHISVSLIAAHGADKFLLDTVSDMYSSLQEQISFASNLPPAPDTNGDMEVSELLKEKGNTAFKGKQWNKAVNLYTEAIKLNDTNTTYYSNRAAAYLQLGCFQQAEVDCNQAISLEKKNVKAYLRRGTAREMLLYYKEACQDFKHALVLEPQNKAALAAERRLRKLIS